MAASFDLSGHGQGREAGSKTPPGNRKAGHRNQPVHTGGRAQTVSPLSRVAEATSSTTTCIRGGTRSGKRGVSLLRGGRLSSGCSRADTNAEPPRTARFHFARRQPPASIRFGARRRSRGTPSAGGGGILRCVSVSHREEEAFAERNRVISIRLRDRPSPPTQGWQPA
ncbi:hypothetical protein AAFF_G00098740 [Aldrovandia affinis]|uniref:Uncharacterized protein n=1 Tax=Aldrovandia affinis TaxID=143900 RepID=A0AAD7RV76_9TELE|nr:hypothetical protein AAFF_G00098740 [Aldrovandia affinis]